MRLNAVHREDQILKKLKDYVGRANEEIHPMSFRKSYEQQNPIHYQGSYTMYNTRDDHKRYQRQKYERFTYLNEQKRSTMYDFNSCREQRKSENKKKNCYIDSKKGKLSHRNKENERLQLTHLGKFHSYELSNVQGKSQANCLRVKDQNPKNNPIFGDQFSYQFPTRDEFPYQNFKTERSINQKSKQPSKIQVQRKNGLRINFKSKRQTSKYENKFNTQRNEVYNRGILSNTSRQIQRDFDKPVASLMLPQEKPVFKCTIGGISAQSKSSRNKKYQYDIGARESKILTPTKQLSQSLKKKQLKTNIPKLSTSAKSLSLPPNRPFSHQSRSDKTIKHLSPPKTNLWQIKEANTEDDDTKNKLQKITKLNDKINARIQDIVSGFGISPQ